MNFGMQPDEFWLRAEEEFRKLIEVEIPKEADE
jgi:hypothetical protein